MDVCVYANSDDTHSASRVREAESRWAMRRERATCPPHSSKTIDRLDHCSLRPTLGISREFRSNFPNRIVRDSSGHAPVGVGTVTSCPLSDAATGLPWSVIPPIEVAAQGASVRFMHSPPLPPTRRSTRPDPRRLRGVAGSRLGRLMTLRASDPRTR